MVGEHDWYLDLGQKWQEMFGKPTYSFDHKGVHFVVLNSVVERDFWTARGMSPMERMKTVAGLDNDVQSPFTVGEEQRKWLKDDLAKHPDDARIIVFSHSPLYKLYKQWNFWTDDAEEVQAILQAVQAGGGHPRPHPPTVDQSHRQHPFPRDAFDGLAVALCPGGHARADDPDGPSRPVRPQRRLRRRPGAGVRGRIDRQGLRPVEPQPGHGEQGIHGQLGETERAAASPTGRPTERKKEIKHEQYVDPCPSGGPLGRRRPVCCWRACWPGVCKRAG